MKCLITGGSGFLGRSVVKLCLLWRQGATGTDAGSMYYGTPQQPQLPYLFDEVIVLDRQELDMEDEYIPELSTHSQRIQSFVGDICDQDLLNKLCQGCDVVFHVASIVSVSLHHNPNVYKVNVEGTKCVLNACRAAKVKALVYTSTMDVVLDGSPKVNASEDETGYGTGMNDYAATKTTAERLVLAANGVGGLLTAAVRPTHLYGPRDPHALIQSAEAMKAGMPCRLGDGSARFAFGYVENVAHMHVLAARCLLEEADDPRARSNSAYKANGEAFFGAEGFSVNYFDFIRPYMKCKGYDVPKPYLPSWLVYCLACIVHVLYTCIFQWSFVKNVYVFEPRVTFFLYHLLCEDYFFSHQKATDRLGYKPIIDQETALKRTLVWFDRQDV